MKEGIPGLGGGSKSSPELGHQKSSGPFAWILAPDYTPLLP